MRCVNNYLYSLLRIRYDHPMQIRTSFAIGFLTLILSGGAFAYTPAVIPLSDEEKTFVDLINRFRWRLGLSRLEVHPLLQEVSRSHSEWMAKYNLLQHNGPYLNTTFDQRIQQAGFINYTFLAENISCGYADAINAFRQWAQSPPHLQNMVNPHFHYLGIARAGNINQPCPFFWTNDFASDSDPRFDPSPVLSPQNIQEAIRNVTSKP